MFSYRGLFLAVTVSLASIVLADVLVQPGYEHRYNGNQRYSQHQPVQYQMQAPVVQYRAQQLPDQESTRYLSGVQTVHPYSDSQDNARSHLVRYPHRLPYHHYLSRPNHLHYSKIGGHGYVRPSVFLGYPQPLTVHNRYKRSDPTSIESRKSEIAAHDNDVAAKSPLTDTEHPTAIDSLLPEHEPTDTNDKRVENRQINDDYVKKPRLFGLYPEKMYSEHRSVDNPHTNSIHGVFEDTISRISPPSLEESDDNDDDYRSKITTAIEQREMEMEQQRDAHQEHTTNMDMISTAQPRQYYDSRLPLSDPTNSIESPIRVSDYVLHTNINARNYLPEMLQTLLGRYSKSEKKQDPQPSYSIFERIPVYVEPYDLYP